MTTNRDPKIAALATAIRRVATVAPAIVVLASPNNPWSRRFAALWQARNRRARVAMVRARQSYGADVNPDPEC